MPKSVRLSLLDRTRTRSGEADAVALHRTVARAQRAEALGYHRFWVAEHHGVPGVAGSGPAPLLAALGAATQDIRIGSGGVMLPNHAPFVVAEQFLVLEGLYPNRVDLGVGRSVGFTAPVRRMLRTEASAVERFGDDLSELRDVLAGTASVTARPATGHPPLFVLAIKQGLEFAGQAGLPAVVGGPLLRNPEALRRYRQDAGDNAYLIVSADIMIADTHERARQLLLPEAWAMAHSRETGEFGPLESVEDVLARQLTSRQNARIQTWLSDAIFGDAASVAAALDDLIARTGADEIMATTSTYADADRDNADAALAELMAWPGIEDVSRPLRPDG